MKLMNNAAYQERIHKKNRIFFMMISQKKNMTRNPQILCSFEVV